MTALLASLTSYDNKEKPLAESEINDYLKEIPDWKLGEGGELRREFSFNNFQEALNFVNQVGSLAEVLNHHPNIFLHDYKKVTLILKTHRVDALTLNDFILAAKISEEIADII